MLCSILKLHEQDLHLLDNVECNRLHRTDLSKRMARTCSYNGGWGYLISMNISQSCASEAVQTYGAAESKCCNMIIGLERINK